MAISAAVFVGDSIDWVEDIKEKASKLKLGAGYEQSADMGPLISKEAKERVNGLIGTGIEVVGGMHISIATHLPPPNLNSMCFLAAFSFTGRCKLRA